MSAPTATLFALATLTYALKVSGPVLLGGDRRLSPRLQRLVAPLPVALLAALVATSTFVDDRARMLDARAVGLAVAGIALWRKLPFVVVVVLAAAAAAAVRAGT